MCLALRCTPNGLRSCNLNQTSESFVLPRLRSGSTPSIWPSGDRAERVIAAELLAPASGLELFLDDHFDAADRERAAEHFEVSGYIIDHQLENQLGVPATW